MKNFISNPIFKLEGEAYLTLLVVMAPLLNFLSGINIDLYAPSMPAIGKYFGVSITFAKDTIAVSMIGFGIGCIIFGTLMDIIGRRRVILFGLLVYTIASAAALECDTIGH